MKFTGLKCISVARESLGLVWHRWPKAAQMQFHFGRWLVRNGCNDSMSRDGVMQKSDGKLPAGVANHCLGSRGIPSLLISALDSTSKAPDRRDHRSWTTSSYRRLPRGVFGFIENFLWIFTWIVLYKQQHVRLAENR